MIHYLKIEVLHQIMWLSTFIKCSLLCALQGVLLLLLYVAASEVQNIRARPIDFVCDFQARRSMNKVEEMESAMVRTPDLRYLQRDIVHICCICQFPPVCLYFRVSAMGPASLSLLCHCLV